MTTPFLKPDIGHDEGCTLTAIADALSHGAPWTIGKGHTGQDVHPGMTITQGEAEALFDRDVANAMRGLDVALPWWRQLNDARQDVLVNMAFNMGVAGLMQFTRSLAAIRAGDWPDAAVDLRASAWARELPQRSARLIKQMLTGVRTPQPWDPKS